MPSCPALPCNLRALGALPALRVLSHIEQDYKICLQFLFRLISLWFNSVFFASSFSNSAIDDKPKYSNTVDKIKEMKYFNHCGNCFYLCNSQFSAVFTYLTIFLSYETNLKIKQSENIKNLAKVEFRMDLYTTKMTGVKS